MPPRYKRWTVGVWHTLLAIAFRLSPSRRAPFIVAILLLTLSWLRYGFEGALSWFLSAPSWGLLSASLLFLLLILELRDKLTLRGEVEIARDIQVGLLSTARYEQDGITVSAAMHPALLVGGDYFDVVERGAGEVVVVIADVAGKGIPAALLMTLLHGSLRTLVAVGSGGASLVGTLNAHLCRNIPPNRLVTLFYGELNTRDGRLRFVNAGHNPPFLLRGHGVDRLMPTGLALGVAPGATYDETEVVLAPGDRLVAFTDGITEAMDRESREYGEARLERLLCAIRGCAARELVHRVEADVSDHCGDARQYDDMTLLVVARNAPASGEDIR